MQFRHDDKHSWKAVDIGIKHGLPNLIDSGSSAIPQLGCCGTMSILL